METVTEQRWGPEPDRTPAVVVAAKVETPIDDEGTDIERVLNELPNPEDYINVWKYSDNGEDRAYKNKMPVKDFSLFRLRDRFGAGRYHLDFFSRRGKTKATRVAARTVFIDNENETPGPGASTVPADIGQNIQTSMQAAMVPVYAILEKLGTLIVESRVPAQDPAAMLLGMTQVLKNLHDVSPPAAGLSPPPVVAPDNHLQDMKDMMSLAREFTGGAGGEHAHLDLLDKMIDKIAMPMIDAAQKQTTEKDQPKDVANTGGSNPMKMYAAMLIQSAMKGEDPGNWVGLICDRVPPDVLRELITDPVARLGELDPRAAQVSAWLNQLGSFISEELDIRAEEKKEPENAVEKPTSSAADGKD